MAPSVSGALGPPWPTQRATASSVQSCSVKSISPIRYSMGSFDNEWPRIMRHEADLRIGPEGYDGEWCEWRANQAIGRLLSARPLVEACVELLGEVKGSLGVRELPTPKLSRAAQLVAATFDANPGPARTRFNAVFPR